MLIAVVDLEATCSDDGSVLREEMETIEIGCVVLCGTDGGTSEFDAFVRPRRHPKLTEFCKRLTGISQDDVDGAGPFGEVFPRFVGWLRGFGLPGFASWGDFDVKQLRRDCRLNEVCYPFVEHVNLSGLFQKQTGRRRGHRRAMKFFGLSPVGRHHRGVDDARNIARMVPLLLPRRN